MEFKLEREKIVIVKIKITSYMHGLIDFAPKILCFCE